VAALALPATVSRIGVSTRPGEHRRWAEHTERVAGLGGLGPLCRGAGVVVQDEVDVDRVGLRMVCTNGVAAHPGPLGLGYRVVRLIPPHEIAVRVRFRKAGHSLAGFREVQLHLLIGLVVGEAGKIVATEGDARHARCDPLDPGDLDVPDRHFLHRILRK
jgi:hypothetical protein